VSAPWSRLLRKCAERRARDAALRALVRALDDTGTPGARMHLGDRHLASVVSLDLTEPAGSGFVEVYAPPRRCGGAGRSPWFVPAQRRQTAVADVRLEVIHSAHDGQVHASGLVSRVSALHAVQRAGGHDCPGAACTWSMLDTAA
jgi:hypothetical protein